jgi:predicted metal-dependent enzyme (double-stranded beta helix superfamily)
MEGAPRADKFLGATDGEQRFRRHPLAAINGDGLSALLMYWPPGHATLPHDHDGLWGIELILDGTLAVHEFVRVDDSEASALAPSGTKLLGIGDAVLFTGPRYVHRCRNLSNAYPTLTLHIYGSDLNAFNVWEPDRSGRLAARRVIAALDKTLLN